MQRKKKKSLLLIWLILRTLLLEENVDEDNIDEWINCDVNDPGFKHLTDEQIVGGALGMISENEDENDEAQFTVKQVSHKSSSKTH